MESKNLIALADEQLDMVAGGCGGKKDYEDYGYGYSYGDRKSRKSRGDVNVDVDVVTVIFKDNDIQANGDITFNVFAEA